MNKLIVLLLTLSLSAATYAQTISQIVDGNIKARGGMDLLTKLKTVEVANSTETPMGPMKSKLYIQDGVGYRVEFDMMGATNFFLVTKDAGYMYMPISGKKDVTKMDEKQFDMMKQQLNLNGELYQFQLTQKGLEMGGEESVNDEPCWVLTSPTAMSPEPKKIYVSKKSYQVIKESAQVETPEGIVEAASYYGDFKKTPEGYTLPMFIKNDRGETKVESYKINPTFDASMFEPKSRATK